MMESNSLRCAYSTFSMDKIGYINVIECDESGGELDFFSSVKYQDQPIPPTSLQFYPTSLNSYYGKELFITSGDGIRVFSVNRDQCILESIMRDPNHSLPICGFDWCQMVPSTLCSYSLDNTCSLWDLESNQLIKNFRLKQMQSQIFDLKCSPDNANLFALANEKGLLQLVDTRTEKSSLLLYKSDDAPDLMGLSWSIVDTNQIATFASDSNKVIVFDIRKEFEPKTQLSILNNKVNCIDWSPIDANQLSIGTLNNKTLIWSIKPSTQTENTLNEFASEGEVNDIKWNRHDSNWIGVSISNSIHFLHV